MPDNEVWTYNVFDGAGADATRIVRAGLNLGAPGDHQAENGTLWLDYPSLGGASPEIDVTMEGSLEWFRFHRSRVSGEGSPAVAASGVKGVRALTLWLVPRPESVLASGIPPGAGSDDAEESDSGKVSLTSSDLGVDQASNGEAPKPEASSPERPYTVRLHFLEPEADVQPGQRVFDVVVQGQTVLRGWDIVEQAGGPFRSIVKEFPHVPVAEGLRIECVGNGGKPPVLCGVEIREERP
jgi:hypothetical protein